MRLPNVWVVGGARVPRKENPFIQYPAERILHLLNCHSLCVVDCYSNTETEMFEDLTQSDKRDKHWEDYKSQFGW